MADRRTESGNDKPLVSVIVPVYNDSSGIGVTLSSLVAQTYPTRTHEILVVDNGSSDGTRDVIHEFAEEHSQVRLLVEDAIQSSYAARNRGIREARGDILAFIDADMWVEDSWLCEVVESLDVHDIPYIGCDVEISVSDEGRSIVQRFIQRMLWDIEAFIQNDHFAPTACLVVRKELFEAVDLFDDRLISGGDMEFGQRIHQAGFKQRFEGGVTVYHPARSSVRGLLSKMFRVGRGLYQYHRYHPNRFEKRIWLQPGSYLPPHPRRFYHRVRQNAESSSFIEIISFYLLAYSIRLSRTAGVAYESCRHLLSGEDTTSTATDER
jgi:glycosyltransferase involved in cell wall biosynthesis